MQALQHGEVIRPLGSQLGLKLRVVMTPFAISSFASASVMAQSADHQFFKA
jgi:hypothetical protein